MCQLFVWEKLCFVIIFLKVFNFFLGFLFLFLFLLWRWRVAFRTTFGCGCLFLFGFFEIWWWWLAIWAALWLWYWFLFLLLFSLFWFWLSLFLLNYALIWGVRLRVAALISVIFLQINQANHNQLFFFVICFYTPPPCLNLFKLL